MEEKMYDFCDELMKNKVFVKFFEEHSNKNNLINIFENLMESYNNMCKNTQDNYFIKSEMSELKYYINEKTNEIKENNNKVLNKFSNSSIKGKISENILEEELNKMYKSAEIINTSKKGNQGDFIIKREDMTDIMIENKCYKTNIPRKEVDKFERDVRENNIHGILLSQTSGIANKDKFSYKIGEGKMRVYISDVNYDTTIIKIAVNLIDCYEREIIRKREENKDQNVSEDEINEMKEKIEEHDKQVKEIIEEQETHCKKTIKRLENIYITDIFSKVLKIKTENKWGNVMY